MKLWLAMLVVVCGCSSENAGGASSATPQSSGKTAKSASAAPAANSAPPAKASAATTASAAAPIEVKAANVPANALGVTMTIKSGAMDGDSYKAKAEVENKGPKEISAVSWRVCGYDASGKLQDKDTTNGGDAKAKANDKAELEVWVKPAPLVGFRVTSVKFPDGSTKAPDAKDTECPETIKP
jgi:hypothetical protein